MGTPVYGLSSYPVSRYALRLPKIGDYTGSTTAPTNPTFKGAGDGQCTSTSYCEAMYDLSVKEKIPVSQLGQITSTDLANGVLISQGYTAFVNPGSTIAAGAGATALQAFVNAGGTYIGTVAGGTTSARNAGITLLNTSSITGLSTPGSTFDGVFSRRRPRAGASTPAAGSTAPRAATRRSTRRRWSATGRRSRPRPRS